MTRVGGEPTLLLRVMQPSFFADAGGPCTSCSRRPHHDCIDVAVGIRYHRGSDVLMGIR
jgi:hypothetical protein